MTKVNFTNPVEYLSNTKLFNDKLNSFICKIKKRNSGTELLKYYNIVLKNFVLYYANRIFLRLVDLSVANI